MNKAGGNIDDGIVTRLSGTCHNKLPTLVINQLEHTVTLCCFKLSSTMATPSVSQQTDPLNTIFLGLRNKSPETRLQSALELRRYVRASATHLLFTLNGNHHPRLPRRWLKCLQMPRQSYGKIP